MKNRFSMTKEERKRFQCHVVRDDYRMLRYCGLVICILQAIMLVLNYAPGVETPRQLGYRFLYYALIAATLLAEVLLWFLHRREETVGLFYSVTWCYLLILFLWSVGITYLDFLGTHAALTTFAYGLLASAAIILLEPWSVFLSSSVCSLLMVYLISTTPHFSFGLCIQIFSVFALTNVVSIVSYNRRLNLVQMEFRQMDSLKEIHQLNERLKVDASMDALTGLYNRRFLTERSDWELHTGANPSGILMADIDHFKQINDTYGHPFGDECLRYLGRVIRAHMRRPEDYAVRYGGEEFLLYFDRTTREELLQEAESIRLAVQSTPVTLGDMERTITVSIGCASAESESNYNAVIAAADENLYHAKEAGRNRIYPPIPG